MLQWFCTGDPDDAYGLTFDDPRAGVDGMIVRWWSTADLTRPASRAPTEAAPYEPFNGYAAAEPLLSPDPVALDFWPAPSLPGPNDEVAGVSTEYDESLDLLPLPAGCHVGGHPYLAQADPRPQHPNRVATLLVQLHSDKTDLFMWGDMGSAQLFGDPAEVAHGRTASLWWDWAC